MQSHRHIETDHESLSAFTTASGPATPQSNTFPHHHRAFSDLVVADPKTPAGHLSGAILLVKSTPAYGSAETPLLNGNWTRNRQLEVHELVEVLEHRGAWVSVRPLRTGGPPWLVPWSVFFPLMRRTRCVCAEGTCRCEVEYPWNYVPKGIHAIAHPPLESDPPTQPASTSGPAIAKDPTLPPVLAADPYTLAGQTIGAILVIKCHAVGFTYDHEDCPISVGDFIQLLSGPSKDSGRVVPAKNLRTGVSGHIIWNSVFPLQEREVCYCYPAFEGTCACVYVDFEKSRAHWKLSN